MMKMLESFAQSYDRSAMSISMHEITLYHSSSCRLAMIESLALITLSMMYFLTSSWKRKIKIDLSLESSERRKENSIRFRILCSSCPSFLTSDWVYTLQTHTHWLIAIHVFSRLFSECSETKNMEVHSNGRLILFHYFESTFVYLLSENTQLHLVPCGLDLFILRL